MRPDEDERPTRSLDFVVVGAFPLPLAEDLVARASRRLSVPCRLLRGAVVATARVEGRDQLDAHRLHRDLEARASTLPDGHALMGLTEQDIGSALFTYFFGLGDPKGRSALVSIARLAPTFYGLPNDPETTARRAVTEILHEFGHVAGLVHCGDSGCIMHHSMNVESLDARGTTYCPACTARLPSDLRPRRAGAR